MQNLSEVKANRDLQLSVREALSSKREVFPKESVTAEPLYNSDDEASFDARMRLQILSKRKELGDLPTKQKFRNGNFLLSISQSTACCSKWNLLLLSCYLSFFLWTNYKIEMTVLFRIIASAVGSRQLGNIPFVNICFYINLTTW